MFQFTWWLLLAAALAPAQDFESAVRALRPADVKPAEQAMLDSLEREARESLAAIRHARTGAEADRQRPVLRAKLEDSLGWRRLPWPPKLNTRLTGTIRRGGYRIEKLVWETLPGVATPAHLYIPDGLRGPAPAVLFYIGHWWPDSKTRPDFQAFSINMARLGFVVLTWDPFGQGERGISSRDHRRVESLLVGVSQQGIAEYETQVALQYLLSRSEVDPKHIGMTGASGGGYNTWITAALDDRISVAVPVVGTSDFYEQIHVTRPLDWYRASEHCHFVPGLIRYADNHELLAMISPRPLMIIAASEDQSFPVAGVRKVHEYGRELYRASGAEGRIGYSEDSTTGHGYQQKKREAAYGWFLKWLMSRGDGGPHPEPPTEVPAFDDPELRCLPPGKNAAAGPGIIAAVRALAGEAKPDRTIAPLKVTRPQVAPLTNQQVQRLLIPAADGLPIPSFLIRGSGQGVLLSAADAGKESLLDQDRVRSAIREGWSVLGVDPRGIGELATTQTGWLSAVSLLLGESFLERQARDLLTAAAIFEGRPIRVFARGPNAALAAARALPHLSKLESYTLQEGFSSYRDFLDRPQALEASYQLRADNNERFAYDREIPFFFVPWKGLLGPDLPDLLKTSKSEAAAKRIQVLLLGSFHMDNPDRDLANVASDDILSGKRQAELDALVDRLAAFQPTKIAVEVPFRYGSGEQAAGANRRSALYTDRYAEYLAGQGEPDRNEVYQLAFRLGKRLGLERIHGIDHPLDLPMGPVMQSARQNGQTALLAQSMADAKATAATMSKRLSASPLLDYFAYLNQPETLASSHRPYLKYPVRVGQDQNYVGADMVADWYKRNLRIFANLLRIAEEGDRIFVLFGLGHAQILRQLIADSEDFELVDPLGYLE